MAATRDHKRYLDLLASRATRRAGKMFDWSSLVGATLFVLGIGGGVTAALWDQAVVKAVFPVLAPLISGFGVYLISKDVWEEPQRLVDAQSERKPLMIGGTSHEQDWRRLRIQNPNSFPVPDAYVAIARYVEQQLPIDLSRELPPEGFVFNWSTWGNSKGTIGAEDFLIVDVVKVHGESFRAHHIG